MEFENIEWTQVIQAFLLTLFAGLSTGIGSGIAFVARRTNKSFLSLALGFSAGVMIYVSFIEIFPKAMDAFAEIVSERLAHLYTVLSFFGGVLFIGVIDRLIPSYENPHEPHLVEELRGEQRRKKMVRMGMFSALAIAIHNFPEGLATFIAGLSAPEIAYSIAIAIAIHNIPEGIAVSVPIYYATGSKRKAFLYSFLSGLAEPVGAVIGFLLIYFFFGINTTILGVLFGGVAGIMVFISLDELLPAAKEYGEHHLSIYGLFAGMLLMAISLLIF